jgi:hypothetical protein
VYFKISSFKFVSFSRVSVYVLYSTNNKSCSVINFFLGFQIPRRHGAADDRGGFDLRGRELHHLRSRSEEEDQELGEAGDPVQRWSEDPRTTTIPVSIVVASRRQHRGIILCVGLAIFSDLVFVDLNGFLKCF